MNHHEFDKRIAFVHSILHLNDLEAVEIEPLDYEADSPHMYNNYVYLVTLKSPTKSSKRFIPSIGEKGKNELQPGTALLPNNTNSIVFRLSNSDPRTELNNANRVENEVASINLARQALQNSPYSHIVPAIYAWASFLPPTGQGFTIQQHMPGTMLKIRDISLKEQSMIVEMADILGLIQKFPIPSSVTSFGGLRYEDGQVVSGEMTIWKGPPQPTYEGYMRNMLSQKLKETDGNMVVNGWRANGVRERLEEYMGRGLTDLFNGFNPAKVLVHSDFGPYNFLFDANSRIVALLDFDFSYVGSAADEFFSASLSAIPGAKLPSLYSDPNELLLRKAILTGFEAPIPESIEDESRGQWEVAKAWDNELKRAGAARPSLIQQFEEIGSVYWLAETVLPFVLGNEFMRRRRSEEVEELRKETEDAIMKFLDDAGF